MADNKPKASSVTFDFRGHVALITGASSGIGAVTAQHFAQAGATLGLLDFDREALGRTADWLRNEHDARVEEVVADVSNADQMRQAIDRVVEKLGGIDLVFANAGTNGTWAPLDELEDDEWRRTLDVNLTGSYLALKYAFPHLKESAGSVVLNASVNGTRIFSNSGAAAYASSKAGQAALAQMLAVEWARFGIRVNVICPGAIETPIHDKTERRDLDSVGEPVEYPEGSIPLTDGKPGDAAQVAQLVLFLSSSAAGHITGTPVWIDGAESLLKG